MIPNGTSSLPVEIDAEPVTKEQVYFQNGEHQEPQGVVDGQEQQAAVHDDSQDSPGKILMQSVSEMLLQSAQSVKALVSGSGLPNSDAENGEEKTLLQAMGEKIVQSAQSVKDAVNGNSESGTAENGEEKTLLQSVGERIVQSAQSVKDAVNGNTSENENGEEKTLLQAVGERIVQSAKTVKDAVNGSSEHITTDVDETGEASILVHSILD